MDTKLNRSDVMLFVIYYSVSVLMAVYEYATHGNKLIEYLLDIPTFIVLDLGMILIFMYWLLPDYIINNKKYVHFTFWGVFFMILAGFIENVVGFYSGGGDWSTFKYGIQNCINYLSNTAQSIGLPFGLLLAKKYYENQVLFSNIKQQQKENELKLLRSQISPHFLFNNLNTLDALIDIDKQKAKEYINRLSLIYRYLIQTKDAEVMELTDEMNFAENYIFLLKTRFGDDYQFEILQKSSPEGKYIPTGAIQTLLENIAKHNRAQNGKTINAKIQVTNEWLTVSNSKSNSVASTDSLGTGLKNLEYRYRLLSDKKIVIINTLDTFTVKIPIMPLSNEL